MRHLYSFLLFLLSPLLLAYLYLKEHARNREPGFLQRLGFVKLQTDIWIHAASVGEVKAACILIKEFQKNYPKFKIAISAMTCTGRAEVRRQLGTDFAHFYFGLDLSFIWRNIISHMRPKLLIILEQEIWPNLIHICQESKVKTYLMNAKYSESSLKNRLPFNFLFINSYLQLDFIGTQTQKDESYFLKLGVEQAKCQYVGNIKFDLELSELVRVKAKDIRKTIGMNRPVWIAGSTHDGEEEIIFAGHRELKKKYPNIFLVIFPRHPKRFENVRRQAQQLGFNILLRSAKPALVPADTDVLIGDTMGELSIFYGAADVAFIGGSLVPFGGHNLLEAAVVGTPAITGEFASNFTEIIDMAVGAGYAAIAKNTAELIAQVSCLLDSKELRDRAKQAGYGLINKNKGVVAVNIQTVLCLLRQGQDSH